MITSDFIQLKLSCIRMSETLSAVAEKEEDLKRSTLLTSLAAVNAALVVILEHIIETNDIHI